MSNPADSFTDCEWEPDRNYSGVHQCVCPKCGRFGWHPVFTGNHPVWGGYVCKARGDSDPWESIPEERHRDAWRHAKALFDMYGRASGPIPFEGPDAADAEHAGRAEIATRSLDDPNEAFHAGFKAGAVRQHNRSIES